MQRVAAYFAACHVAASAENPCVMGFSFCFVFEVMLHRSEHQLIVFAAVKRISKPVFSAINVFCTVKNGGNASFAQLRSS
ncbi:hypothetical protein [Paenibacillus sp. BAC0078]